MSDQHARTGEPNEDAVRTAATGRSSSSDERTFYCPCGLTSMVTTPPAAARLLVSTFRCRHCGEPVRVVPTAWDQP